MNNRARRVSYVFLCAALFATLALVGARPLRVSGVYQPVGAALFGLFCVSVWTLRVRQHPQHESGTRTPAMLAGVLLLFPFALIALLWVGLATPWDATPEENRMRYVVLFIGSVAVTGGLVILKDLLAGSGERVYPALGFVAGLLAGAGYLVWTTFMIGAWSARIHADAPTPVPRALDEALDTLLFASCVLTYAATAVFALAMRRAGWIGRAASASCVLLSALALVMIVARGLSFPDPTTGVSPWYTRPGFIAGIPAVPWILPYFLGVGLLRRAGGELPARAVST